VTVTELKCPSVVTYSYICTKVPLYMRCDIHGSGLAAPEYKSHCTSEAALLISSPQLPAAESPSHGASMIIHSSTATGRLGPAFLRSD
jgi:hypothetical protein